MTVILPRAAGPMEAPGPSEPSLPVLVDSLRAVLSELANLLASLTREQYAAKPVGVVSSSLGAQVRHCLDHVAAWCAAAAGGVMTYDRRQRDTEIEKDRNAALHAIEQQDRALSTLCWADGHPPIRLTALVSPALPPVMVETTLERELLFVLSHTIHHNALIAVMARTLGVSVPGDFGFAPATLAQEGSCLVSGRACTNPT